MRFETSLDILRIAPQPEVERAWCPSVASLAEKWGFWGKKYEFLGMGQNISYFCTPEFGTGQEKLCEELKTPPDS
jgi:hypothetical protein